MTTNVLSPFSPFAYLEAVAQIMRAGWKPWEEYFATLHRDLRLAGVPGTKARALSPDQRSLLASLMSEVRTTATPGEFRGALMTRGRTEQCAQLSGDHNVRHMAEEGAISHGMDTITQAFAALKIHEGGAALVPKRVKIEFRKPVITGEMSLWIHIPPPVSGSLERLIEVFAVSIHVPEETLVAKLFVFLKHDDAFDDEGWFQILLSCWQISSHLAGEFPGCTYYGQTLDFGRLTSGVALVTLLRGAGRNEKGFPVLHTHAYCPSEPGRPLAIGQAVIVLP